MRALDEKKSVGIESGAIAFYASAIVLASAYAAIAFLICHRLVFISGTDFYIHGTTASEFTLSNGLSDFVLNHRYPGWGICVKLLMMAGMSLSASASLVTASFSFLVVLVSMFIAYEIIGGKRYVLPLAVGVIVVFVSAIYVPWFNEQIYLGQGSPTIWHNPTYIAVRPFSLLSCYVLYVSLKGRRLTLRLGVIYSLLTVICLLIKPSFFQFQFPAIVLFCIIDYALNRDLAFCLKLLSTFLPGLLIAAAQFVLLFGIGNTESNTGISFTFFGNLVYSSNSPFRPFSVLLLLAFPLFSIWALREDIFSKGSPYWVLIIMFLVAFSEAMCFKETGLRENHGNFMWGYYNSVFILWAFLLPLFLKRSLVDRSMSIPVMVIGFSLVALHFASGCILCATFLDGSQTL